ncbi:unnamed protein product [Rodentolepis nana]|uniref:DUF3480 domain-containing protein n=1 Tax=Rodentolepis nana TaxID=102285 RepID=A0A0R3TB28_RODNA|nr:unnamed protein product [Rodentolepis nana]
MFLLLRAYAFGTKLQDWRFELKLIESGWTDPRFSSFIISDDTSLFCVPPVEVPFLHTHSIADDNLRNILQPINDLLLIIAAEISPNTYLQRHTSTGFGKLFQSSLFRHVTLTYE